MIFALTAASASGVHAQVSGENEGSNQLIATPATGGGGIRPVGGMALPSTVDVSHSTLIALLRRADVVKSLRLTRSQAEELDPILRNYEPGMLKAAAKPYQPYSKELLNQFSTEQLSGLQRKAALAQSNYIKQAVQQINDALRPSQAARLAQLDLQYRTPLAMVEPAVAARFKATPAQTEAIKAEATACQDETADLLQREVTAFQLQKQKDDLRAPHRLKPEEAAKKNTEEMQKLLKSLKPQIFDIRNSHGRKALAMLTEEQQQAWKTACGSEFDFDNQE